MTADGEKRIVHTTEIMGCNQGSSYIHRRGGGAVRNNTGLNQHLLVNGNGQGAIISTGFFCDPRRPVCSFIKSKFFESI